MYATKCAGCSRPTFNGKYCKTCEQFNKKNKVCEKCGGTYGNRQIHGLRQCKCEYLDFPGPVIKKG